MNNRRHKTGEIDAKDLNIRATRQKSYCITEKSIEKMESERKKARRADQEATLNDVYRTTVAVQHQETDETAPKILREQS